MKRKVFWRITGIGIFHAVLYLFIVPFVIYPQYGSIGITIAVIVAVVISTIVFGTSVFERKNKGEKDG